MAYSIYNVQCFISARVSEVDGTIALQLAHTDKIFVIDKDDELYEHHLKNIQVSRDQIIKAYPLTDTPVEEVKPNPLKGI